MNSYFSILFSLRFRHGYFGGTNSSYLSIVPDAASQNFIQNNNLLFKRKDDAFILLYEAESNGQVRSREEVLKETQVLRFVVKLQDPLFYNYTECGAADVAKGLFCFKTGTQDSVQSDGTQLLHRQEFAGSEDWLRTEAAGVDYFEKPFAVIDVQLNKIFSQELSVHFKEKATYWRYLIVSEHLKNLNEPAVINGNEVFKGPSKLLLPDNTEALAFVSNQPISLQQRSKKKFQLVENFDKDSQKGKVVLRALPVPDINIISSLPKEEAAAEYSEIMI